MSFFSLIISSSAIKFSGAFSLLFLSNLRLSTSYLPNSYCRFILRNKAIERLIRSSTCGQGACWPVGFPPYAAGPLNAKVSRVLLWGPKTTVAAPVLPRELFGGRILQFLCLGVIAGLQQLCMQELEGDAQTLLNISPSVLYLTSHSCAVVSVMSSPFLQL